MGSSLEISHNGTWRQKPGLCLYNAIVIQKMTKVLFVLLLLHFFRFFTRIVGIKIVQLYPVLMIDLLQRFRAVVRMNTHIRVTDENLHTDYTGIFLHRSLRSVHNFLQSRSRNGARWRSDVDTMLPGRADGRQPNGNKWYQSKLRSHRLVIAFG